MSLKAILFLCTLLASHLIAAGLVSGDRPADILLRGRIKRELSIYKFVFGRTSEGIQGPFYYEQAIDQEQEDRPQTFLQRYWVKDTHYRENGPVFLVVGGDVDAEVAAPNLLGENSTCNRLAQKNGGMMVLLEHRYFGKSFPVGDLSEKNLKYLTITQILGDLEQFALRGLNNGLLRSDRVPWVLIGSGYAGGIVHWALTRDPQTFWAGYSLSGMVHATLDFSQYWRDVAMRMPLECANNVGRAVLYFDETIELGDVQGMRYLRDILGLQQIIHFDDVASVLSAGIKALNMPGNEASLQIFCSSLSQGYTSDGTRGILREWGVHNQKKYGGHTDEIWTTHIQNVPKYTDISPSSKFSRTRVLSWLKCMRFGWFQTAPIRIPRLVSLQSNLEREQRICSNYFPGKYRSGIDPQVGRTNSEYGPPDNWPKRAVYLNEENDPYHAVTVLAHLQNKLGLQGRIAVADTDTSGVTVVISSESYEVEGDGYINRWLDLWHA